MLRDKRSRVDADDKFPLLTRKLLTADKKKEKFDGLALAIQACLDIMQNRKQRNTVTGFELNEQPDKITLQLVHPCAIVQLECGMRRQWKLFSHLVTKGL